MNGLLDFISTPAGQGLLAAVAGGMAGANRGTPWNNAGRAGLAGLMGYSNAQNQAMKQEENAFQKQYRQMQMSELEKKAAQQAAQQRWLENNNPATQAIGSALQGGGGPTLDNAANIPQVDPRQKMLWEMAQQGIIPMTEYINATKPKDPKIQALGGGVYDTSAIDPNTGMPKRLGALEQQVPFEYIAGPDGGVQMKPGVLDAKRQIALAGKPASDIKVFNNTKDDFKNERDLRNDFAGLPTTKAFREVENAYDQIKVGLGQKSPAGDMAAATKIMKLLDPGSVVRESELGMAMAATGALDRVSNYFQMMSSGEKLTPNQRKDFESLATKMYDAAVGRYNQSAEEYRGIADDYGLKQDRIAKPAKKSAVSPGRKPGGVKFLGFE